MISGNESSVSLEPKVMDVLNVLYSMQGQVVSQEVIFERVWPNAIFNPSSIQRCIALLRKALNEDSKQPRYILTHPKRGYSLEIPVSQNQTASTRSNYGLVLIVSLFLILGFASAYAYFGKAADVKTTFTTLRPLNSVDANESHLVLAPDGHKAAFVRATEDHYGVWVKRLDSNQETMLLSNSAGYLSLGWSPDSNALAIIEQQENDVHTLAYLTFDPISMTPHPAQQIVQFTESTITSHTLNWATNNTLYYAEKLKNSNDTQLSAVDLSSAATRVVYQSKGKDWLLMHALSPDNKRIALAFEAGQNQYRVDLLNVDSGDVESLAMIEDGVQGLSWHPTQNQLLLSNQNQLFTLDLSGTRQAIAFNNYKIIRDAQYHPNGNEILMELVNIDVDIIRNQPDDPEQFETLIDTSSVDFLPIFSPDGTQFVFESHRFGRKQLFLYHQGQQRLVFTSPDNEEMFGVVWSPNGQYVYTASKDTLYRIDIKTQEVKPINNPHHSFYLREAFNLSNALLVSYRAVNGTTHHPAKFDLDTLTLTPYEVEGEKLGCSALDLDEQDSLYVSNERTVFKLDSNGHFNPVWQSQDKDIIGLTAIHGMLNVIHELEAHYLRSQVNLLDQSVQQTEIGDKQGKMLINASEDFSQVLYLTEPKRKRELVRLQ
ncbi:winged helix-turn-helix domain-containing protein [Shewanella salipaludis]|uniref:winged helix-turn-helix domain-containing protein n=1 Tax=Shewanella salipaludis TaxID=2723052 RepID=UPI0031404302